MIKNKSHTIWKDNKKSNRQEQIMPQIFFPDKGMVKRVKSVDRPGYVYVIAIGREAGITEKVLRVQVEVDGKLLGPRGPSYSTRTMDVLNVYAAIIELLARVNNSKFFSVAFELAKSKGMTMNDLIRVACSEYIERETGEAVR